MFTTRILSGLTFAIVLFLVSACSHFPKDDISFRSDSDPKINIAEYKTFSWLAAAMVVNDPYGLWEPGQLNADAEVQFALNKGLRDKGFTETATEPDFVVLYAAGINMEALELKPDSEFGKNVVLNVPKAALSVILIDAKTEQPIWLGTATAELKQAVETSVAKQRIHYAVEGILKNMPQSN